MTAGALAASTSGSGISPTFALAGNVVVAVVALSGVVVAQRAAVRRDRDAHMWERRAEVYLDLMAWVIHARGLIQRGVRRGLREDLSDEEVAALEPTQEVHAGVQAFASTAVRNLLGSALRSRFLLQHADKINEGAGLLSHFGAELRAFDSTLDDLHRGIRDELARGSTRRSMRQRCAALRWRWHRLRAGVERRGRVRAARRARTAQR